MIDYQRKNAMEIGRLIKKIEELTRRVNELEGLSGGRGTPPVSKLSPKRVKQLKDSVAQS